jgi:hypothetical protein
MEETTFNTQIYNFDIFSIIMKFMEDFHWEPVLVSRNHYNCYKKQAMKIICSSKGDILSLDPKCRKALRCSVASNSWGPFQCIKLTELINVSYINYPPIKAACLTHIDIPGAVNLMPSLTSIVVKDIPSDIQWGEELARLPLKNLWLHHSHEKGCNVSRMLLDYCKNLEKLHLILDQHSDQFTLALPENVKELEISGKGSCLKTALDISRATKLEHL